MARKTSLPRISSVDFFRLTEDEFIGALAQAIENANGKKGKVKSAAEQAALLCWSRLTVDVPNGGFTQFFYNNRGDQGVAAIADRLDTLKESKAANILRDSTAIFKKHKAKFKVDNPWDGLFGSIPEFDKLDRDFCNAAPKCSRAIETWIRKNIADFATDQDGNALDAGFSGVVETRQLNGLTGEYLEVKFGKPSGAYRLYFEDGTVQRFAHYKAGKISGNFWPSGELKKKESKQGKLTVIEWYYPSGRLHKRFVADKDGYAAEPILLYHENGQLAEELHTKQGDKFGKWLKFFDDGKPKLIAEYQKGEKLIIHDAWNDEGKQVVKKGTGTFVESPKSIDWRYDVYIDLTCHQEYELKKGVKHGITKAYNDGVLSNVTQMKNGVADGESIAYWNNGRVESKQKIVKGKTVKTEEFPKFDRPKPAVVLRIRADEDLYRAWGHTPVDEYPQVLNQAKIQSQLKVPPMLQEVYERNQAGEVEAGDYEDWNMFDDGIAYFLTVNEAGEVMRAVPNGSGIYSGREWDTYPPLLRQLRFKPGRIRGQAIKCRVLATVDHTFVEGVK